MTGTPPPAVLAPRRPLDELTSGDSLLAEQVVAIDRFDVHVDDLPRAGAEATDGHRTITVPGVPRAWVVRVQGSAAGDPVAARTLRG
ncbi:hypothetical protein SAMN05660350_01076 [Geodermatophilus obscurus]|uniref:Uncharacterized protein n=1 Tax=Geodermatophilus obscurus TaxID=1861 RepID=A0A1M7SW11_9ACTN|nr:hypothetical protein [Geodermatophilus obscurus]SHN62598.1 hypothetical protein SAMN05660350_01076 [Geodermatophilus obscurus]